MYRWVAIRGEPLCAYFTIEEIAVKVGGKAGVHTPSSPLHSSARRLSSSPAPVQDLGPFVANMYLAEDRILCFEIVAKKHRQWILKYIIGAVRRRAGAGFCSACCLAIDLRRAPPPPSFSTSAPRRTLRGPSRSSSSSAAAG